MSTVHVRTACSYFNPCSNEFHAFQDFQKLSCTQQIVIGLITSLLVCSIIFSPFAIPVFRLLVERCTVKEEADPVDEKTRNVFIEAHSQFSNDQEPEALFADAQNRTQFQCGGDSACTPLAVVFAATASHMVAQKRLGSVDQIGEILDEFATQAQDAGFVSGNNYFVEDSIVLVNKMKKNCQIATVESWTFGSLQTNLASLSKAGENSFPDITCEQLIRSLKPGQGAVLQFAGYSFAVRRLQTCWEFFDSHGGHAMSQSLVFKRSVFKHLNIPNSAYIKRCSSPETAAAFFRLVVQTGPAASGLQGDSGQEQLADSIQITLVKRE